MTAEHANLSPLGRAMLDEAKAHIADWTGPARRRRFVVDTPLEQDRLDAGPDAWNVWLQETTARVCADLDRQVGDYLKAVPPGARVCVHGPEVLLMDGTLAGDETIRWRQTVHQLIEGGKCLRGTGSRVEYQVYGPINSGVTE